MQWLGAKPGLAGVSENELANWFKELLRCQRCMGERRTRRCHSDVCGQEDQLYRTVLESLEKSPVSIHAFGLNNLILAQTEDAGHHATPVGATQEFIDSVRSDVTFGNRERDHGQYRRALTEAPVPPLAHVLPADPWAPAVTCPDCTSPGYGPGGCGVCGAL